MSSTPVRVARLCKASARAVPARSSRLIIRSSSDSSGCALASSSATPGCGLPLPVERSDGNQLDRAHGVAGQDGPRDLGVGTQRLGDRDGTGLECQLGRAVGQVARSEEERGDRDVAPAPMEELIRQR